MKSIYLNILSLVFLVFAISCEKENLNVQEGNYSGTFKVKYNDGREMTGAVTLELTASAYKCSANKNKTPAGGSGTYSYENAIVRFMDQHAWTQDFDQALILAGEYNYTFDGSKLKIWKQITAVGYYEYDLIKNISASE